MRRQMLWMLLMGLLLTSCAGVKVTTNHNENYNFAERTTVRWQEPSVESGFDPATFQTGFFEQLKVEVNAELLGKGYIPVPESADLVIRYRLQTRTSMTVDELERRYPQGISERRSWVDEPGETLPFQEETLVLEFLDARTMNPVWTGYATRAINEKGWPADKLSQTVAKLLENFPPDSK